MNRIFVLILAALFPAFATPAWALDVVTTTQDLAALTTAVGGDRITVSYIVRGDLDPHFVEAKPSYMLKLAKADLVVAVGMDLEIGWLPSLLTGSRNPKVQPGTRGYLDASVAITPIEVPTGTIDRSGGDLHALGNPHYWLDPENGRKVARTIAARLSELDPANKVIYESNLAAFEQTLTTKEAQWSAALASLRGTSIIGYHRTFAYLALAYGMNVVGFVEPKPGLPPTPSHVLDVTATAKAHGVKLIFVEPYHNPRDAASIATACGGRVVVVPTAVGASEDILTYTDLFDAIVRALTTG